jgi:hypothetical protein
MLTMEEDFWHLAVNTIHKLSHALSEARHIGYREMMKCMKKGGNSKLIEILKRCENIIQFILKMTSAKTSKNTQNAVGDSVIFFT